MKPKTLPSLQRPHRPGALPARTIADIASALLAGSSTTRGQDRPPSPPGQQITYSLGSVGLLTEFRT